MANKSRETANLVSNTGISTLRTEFDFVNGPVQIGSATSTGTASQPLQVTGGAYVSGNLGVGATNPGAKLDVAGDVRLSATDAEIEFNTGGARLKSRPNALSIHTGGGLDTETNEQVRINNTGVGIGTTNPTAILHLFNSTTTRQDGGLGRFLAPNMAATADNSIAIGRNYSSTVTAWQSGLIGFYYDGNNTSASNSYMMMNIAGRSNTLVVHTNDTVGIGVTLPERKLHVYGNNAEILLHDPTNSINANRLNMYLSSNTARFRFLNNTGTGGTVFLEGRPDGNISIPASVLNASGRKMLNQTGGILQIVTVNKTDEYYQAGTATPTDVTGLSASITPSSTSSQILVFAHANISAALGGGDSFLQLVRGSTAIGNGAGGYFGQVAGQDYFGVHSRVIFYLDSPATTSSTTYKIQVWGQALYVNSRGYDGIFDTSSQIVLMEIAG